MPVATRQKTMKRDTSCAQPQQLPLRRRTHLLGHHDPVIELLTLQQRMQVVQQRQQVLLPVTVGYHNQYSVPSGAVTWSPRAARLNIRARAHDVTGRYMHGLVEINWVPAHCKTQK